MEFTAPQEASVVMVANRPESAIPKRVSLPSILPADMIDAEFRRLSGLPCCSKCIAAMAMTTNISVIAASTAQPWRLSPTMRPKVKHSAAGIRKIDSICTKLASGVGFS